MARAWSETFGHPPCCQESALKQGSQDGNDAMRYWAAVQKAPTETVHNRVLTHARGSRSSTAPAGVTHVEYFILPKATLDTARRYECHAALQPLVLRRDITVDGRVDSVLLTRPVLHLYLVWAPCCSGSQESESRTHIIESSAFVSSCDVSCHRISCEQNCTPAA